MKKLSGNMALIVGALVFCGLFGSAAWAAGGSGGGSVLADLTPRAATPTTLETAAASPIQGQSISTGSLVGIIPDGDTRGPLGELSPAGLEILTYIFVNGNFETGDFTGWTKSWFDNYGLSGNPPFTGGNIVRTSGGSDQSIIVNATPPETGVDPELGASALLKYPKWGANAARVNGSTTGNISNSILQQMATSAADVDPLDGLIHVRFGFAPVLENPGHSAQDQPFFYVGITNQTAPRNGLLYEEFVFSGQSGVPWLSSPLNPGDVYYTTWQIMDIAPSTSQLAVGDTVQVEFIGADCALGGHFGYLYVDGVGSFIPGITVVKSADKTATSPGGNITYTFLYRNTGTTAATNVVVKENLPAQTSFVSATGGGAYTGPAPGLYTWNIGTLNPGAHGTVTLTVLVDMAASGSIDNGNYTIEGDGASPILGPIVSLPIIPCPVPGAPGVTDVSPCALSGVSITWGSVPGATSYDLQVDGSKVVSAVTSPAVYTPGDSASHTYQVRANGANCTSDWSTGTAGADINLTPNIPTIGTVTVTGPLQLRVSWTAKTPAVTTYNIYRANGACPGGTYALIKGGLTGSPWTDTSVVGGNSYSYKVTAVDATGTCESAASGCAWGTACGPTQASYSATYKAPACTFVSTSCDTGSSSLHCKGANEPNQPNTVNSSCPDGNAGTCGQDESVERLSISSNDGLCLTRGKAVTVTAVFNCSASALDSLSLYYATSIPGGIKPPVWKPIGSTIKCPAPGLNTLIAGIKLTGSAGAVQTVRAEIVRAWVPNSPPPACMSGDYNDRDDLVFKIE